LRKIAYLTNQSPEFYLSKPSEKSENTSHSNTQNNRLSFIEIVDHTQNKFKFVPNRFTPTPPSSQTQQEDNGDYENMSDFKKDEKIDNGSPDHQKFRRRSIQEIFPQINIKHQEKNPTEQQKSSKNRIEKKKIDVDDEFSNPSLKNLNNFDREIQRNLRENLKSDFIVSKNYFNIKNNKLFYS
jgi:hypothetical protein